MRSCLIKSNETEDTLSLIFIVEKYRNITVYKFSNITYFVPNTWDLLFTYSFVYWLFCYPFFIFNLVCIRYNKVEEKVTFPFINFILKGVSVFCFGGYIFYGKIFYFINFGVWEIIISLTMNLFEICCLGWGENANISLWVFVCVKIVSLFFTISILLECVLMVICLCWCR